MDTTKPKVRKVTWVMLGVVALSAAISVAVVWDQVWLKVAYIPDEPLIQIADQQGMVSFYVYAQPYKQYFNGKPIKLIYGSLTAPPTANSAQSYSLRFKWLPGPHRLCVFYDYASREVSREPIVSHWNLDP